MGADMKILDSPPNILKLNRLANPEATSDMNMNNFAEGAHSTSRDSVPTLVDASNMAKSFDMAPSWFLTRARENRIPHFRIGKYVRFDPDEIRAFFQRKPDRHANSEETHPRQDADSKR